ncbi:hypothetical protein L198_02030 [Cryptococcus wingfieldii CBS 7118]|uniref:Uncharacterized protein n=1 Tax=Cryptococcus wingfieldii CBS 7118 TaxID=1295528 RepID=A0A1E3JYP9_9TREE|nr:hypothetical protein L198_02030 [Cryptococcus wingfieldii CBS 7118]ODO05337.1 hypothetical protein L198_02030 [Cryptococcus wingfieldii CBS 7118]
MTACIVVSVASFVCIVDVKPNVSIPAAFTKIYQGGKSVTKSKGKKTSSASKHFIHHHAVKASRTSLPAPAYKAHHYKGSTKVTVTAVPQKWAAGHLEGTTKVLLHRTPAEEVTLSPTSTSTAPKANYKGTHLGGTRVRLTPTQCAASHLGGTKVRLSLAPISGACPPAISQVVPTIFFAPPAPPATVDWTASHLGGTKVLLQRSRVKAWEKMEEKTLATATQAPRRWAASHVGGTRLRLSRTAL